jgi:hypothetical protein
VVLPARGGNERNLSARRQTGVSRGYHLGTGAQPKGLVITHIFLGLVLGILICKLLRR